MFIDALELNELWLCAIGIGALLLDFLLGDPAWLVHPVVIMGKFIDNLESLFRGAFPKNKVGERIGGALLALILPVGTFAFSWAALFLAEMIHPGLWVALELFWGWQCLAVKGLRKESMNVYQTLTPEENIQDARTAVGRIVGRDTKDLDGVGVTKATVETIAENFADGVMAPMFYFLLGGAPLALAYKAINTMDSMVGYKNDKYRYFGTAAARLDDVAGFIPARLAALFWILAAFLTKNDGKGAWKIWRRDRRNHASPNSAQTESACAGALGVQLAGPAYYFGKRYEKPTIGDAKRDIEPEDIPRANKMMYVAAISGELVGTGVRLLLILVLTGVI